MDTLDTVLQIIPALSVSIAAIYYAFNIRHQKKTRQAQLFMQLYSQFNTSEFNKATDEIFFSWDWTDYDDFMRKYGPETNMDAWSFWGSVFEYFHGVSVLVEQRLIDAHLVYELMSGPILRYWEKVEPIFKERRKHLSFPDAIDSVDHLAQEMILIRDKKLASTTKRQ
jgi:hypothetical protein